MGRESWSRLFFSIASIFLSLGSAIAAGVERLFLEPLPRVDARTSIALDQVAREAAGVEPAERSRFLSYLDRARSHDLFAGDGFAYG